MNEIREARRPEVYPVFEEMEEILNNLATEYPDLCDLYSIGKSHRGRDLWMMEITNKHAGNGCEKPGFYIDANTHAEEVLGTTVALETIKYLLKNYGQDDQVTFLLDEMVFYILPRVDPDGAEFCLTQGMQWVGNGRYLPGEEQPDPGFHFCDVDGNGVVAQMRKEDPNGEWRVSDEDPRLMVQRKPHEYGGTYYRLFPEGRIRNYDGAEILFPLPRDGNINRNYPANWLPENHQYGAGELPLSEPETAAICRFILDHPNIAGAQFYHTNGGLILRPFMDKPDAHFPGDDKRIFEAIGQVGADLTGYKLISVYEGFTTDKDKPRSGTSMEWGYEQLGFVCFSTELWDVYGAAGIEREEFLPGEQRSEDRELKLLRWADRQEEPTGYLDWTPFDHPELGEVEIGGWNRLYTFRNPPGDLVAEIATNNLKFTLAHAAAAPRVVIEDVQVDRIEGSVYRISAVVANAGYLPTYLTEMAVREDRAETVKVTLSGNGVTPVVGECTVDLGHLSGRSERTAIWSPFG
ncbi:MAG: M14 family metallopeptidase, partial [Clostridia bacterium]